MTLSLLQLNQRAMLVRLTISKPTTSRRDAGAEQFAQQSLADAGLRVNATLFREKTNPVRALLNASTAIYHYHTLNTLPYIDRGPRLLPVGNYEKYRDELRRMNTDVQVQLARVLPDYDTHIAADIVSRGSRASIGDYPTKEQFETAFAIKFTFSPLPDKSHFLFDIAPEDRDALETQLAEVAEAARADMQQRLAEPLKHLLEKLKKPIGEPGAVFRDSAVNNVTEAVELVRSLAMGDESVLSVCAEVDTAMRGLARNPDMLRESPVVRSDAATRLAAVASKMSWMFPAETA